MTAPEKDLAATCSACGAVTIGDSATCFECGHTPRSAPLKRGQIVSERYELLGVLGKGGMGMVYQAHDRSLDERVALKVLSENARGSAEAERRFRAEIKLARKIRHPNVCAIHEYGELDDIQYIVMELVEGEDLRKYVHTKGALTSGEAIDLACQIGEGLQAIHDAGVIHRDLKLANVMRDNTGRLRLMDFGIAKSMLGEAATATGMILGTPEYMSPEQVQGHHVDARADIYSLGILTYELLTGRVPFKAETTQATLYKQVYDPPPLDDPGIPAEVAPVLRRALAKKPEERYESARAFVAALGAATSSSNSPTVAGRDVATLALSSPPRRGAAPAEPAPLPTVRLAPPSSTRLVRPAARPGSAESPWDGSRAGAAAGPRWGLWSAVAAVVVLGFSITVWLAFRAGGASRVQSEPGPGQGVVEPEPQTETPADEEATAATPPAATVATPESLEMTGGFPSGTVAEASVSSARSDGPAVTSYFEEVEGLDHLGVGDAQSFGTSVVQAAASGDFSSFDDVLAQSRSQGEQLRKLTPPAACQEYHRLALALSDASVAMLVKLKVAISRGDSAALTTIAAQGQAMEARAKELKSLGERIKRRAGV